MQHELIARYIYAVTRNLPQKQRGDVEKELESLISDMLETRCGAIAPTEKDIRVVLTELGAPQELAAKYSGNENKALISGEYFLLYKRVLKIVLPIAAAGIALAGTLSTILDGDQARGALELALLLFAQNLASIIGGAIQAFAIITFVFAVLEHKKVKLSDGDFLDDLPLVPENNMRILPGECIAGMILCIVFVVVFLAFPQVMGGWTEGTGWIPAFDIQAMRSMWIPIVIWAVLGIGREALKLVEGRYTKRVAVVSAIADLVTGVCAAVVFLPGQIMNPAFAPAMHTMLGEVPFIGQVLPRVNLLMFALVMFALVVDLGTTVFRAWKHGRAQGA